MWFDATSALVPADGTNAEYVDYFTTVAVRRRTTDIAVAFADSSPPDSAAGAVVAASAVQRRAQATRSALLPRVFSASSRSDCHTSR
ncbi:hypothetical protein ACWDKQ_28300 [Saccharopolyspora sp. NPDC000995]